MPSRKEQRAMDAQIEKPRQKPIRISYQKFRESALATPCCGETIGEMTERVIALARSEVKGTSPAAALEDLLSTIEGLPVHGLWHHSVAGELLLICLRNAGHAIADDLIDEVVERGRLTPPGACGFLGPCGALVSAASAYAILLGSTPVAADRRERLLQSHARLASRLASLGGSRCCKKSTYTALELAQDEFAKLGFELPREEFAGRCRFFADNETCDGAECVYFPRKN
jgi:hypothetical protein